MIQESIKGFLWIPLTEDPLTSDGGNQSNEASTSTVQSDTNNDTPPVVPGTATTLGMRI